MQVFYCTTFTGHYPVGVAALVVASTEAEARELLDAKLAERGLELKATDVIETLDTSAPLVLVLGDGEY